MENKNRKVYVKRLYNGNATVRSIDIKKAFINKENLLIYLRKTGQHMKVSYEDLKSRIVDVSDKSYQSKFSNDKYKLVDYRWQPASNYQQRLL